MSNQVIFIDRDGVINVDLMGDYIKTPEEFEFEPGAIEALDLLHKAGFKLIIISNQAGVGDGVFTEEALNKVHQCMLDKLTQRNIPIFHTEYCLCGKTDAACECRKPKTGMFEKVQNKVISFTPEKTYFIGDKATDIEAGKRFHLKTAFVRTGHGVNDESKLVGDLEPDLRADNFLEVTKLILS